LIYEGNFENDQREGEGKVTYEKGMMYTIMYKERKATYISGCEKKSKIYKGKFMPKELTGVGNIVDKIDKSEYTGEIWMSKMEELLDNIRLSISFSLLMTQVRGKIRLYCCCIVFCGIFL